MRVILFALALAGCGVNTVHDGSAVAGGSGSAAGSSGVGLGGAGEVAAAGAAGSTGDATSAGEGGTGGDSSPGGAAGDGGEAGSGPAPGSLWSSCAPTIPSCSEDAPSCGPYLERASDQPRDVCTFGCWSLQVIDASHVPKMAPDAALMAQCDAVGGICYAAIGGYYPTCVPSLPKDAQ